jgi:hypothetical protein
MSVCVSREHQKHHFLFAKIGLFDSLSSPVPFIVCVLTRFIHRKKLAKSPQLFTFTKSSWADRGTPRGPE